MAVKVSVMAIIYDDQFLTAYDDAFIKQGKPRPRPNTQQTKGINSPSDEPTYLVAGPGTGKTTVLTLRILKLITCDRIPPGAILATTFTVKAAAELRSRILGWGYPLIEALLKDSSLSTDDRDWLESVDLNQVVTGTLDSLCQEALSQHREPGQQPPIMVDTYLANTVLIREGLFPDGRFRDDDFDGWLLNLKGGGRFGWNLGSKRQLLMGLWDRLHQDQVSIDVLKPQVGHDTVHGNLDKTFEGYRDYLVDHGWLDFAMLENETLQRLKDGRLKDWAERFQVILIDEYQDSNLMQEQIYFELAKQSGASLTIVGDDDQSLYRFRGATVEIFTKFPERFADFFGKPKPSPIFLNTNYRSTQPIISFVNHFIERDATYAEVRVDSKPAITNPLAKDGLPIIGIFRDDPDELAEAVGDFVHQVSNGGYTLPDGATLRLGTNGALGDCCLLASSPREYKPTGRDPMADREMRFPGLLRQAFELRDLNIFNPNGRPVAEIEIVQQFGGLLLEALDPRGMIQATDAVQKRIGNDSMLYFPIWRDEGRLLQRSNAKLDSFIKGWAARDPGRSDYEWPRSVSVLELIYGIVHYLPQLHDDPEGQVYLEVFTRQLAAMCNLSKFEGRLVYDPANPGLGDASVRDLLSDWLAPIADGTVGVDDELIGNFPRGHLPVLSIHQSKGLEFPLVMVDIGSEFKTNHAAHAFKRFPRSGGVSQNLEDLVRPCSDLGAERRTGTNRAFDDLERLYFVAFSRAENVLVLLGHSRTRPDTGRIPNVASGWDRSSANHGPSWPIIYI